MASDEDIRRMIEEIERLRREIRNLKLKVKRRVKKLKITFNPMEKGQIEFEIEMLKGKIRRWEIVESKLSIPLLKGRVNILENKVDWSKSGRA